MPFGFRKAHCARFALSFACLAFAPGGVAQGDDRLEFLLFPDIVASHRTGLVDDGDLRRDQVEGAIDLLFTGNHGSLQFLGEARVASREKELARLYAGWQLSDAATLSLGKFHNLQGYWNTQFHHGMFLQTPISRPGIIEDDGPLPTHYVGAQLEGEMPLADVGSIGYSIGVGKSAVLDNHKLESPDLIGPQRNGRRTAAARLTYSPFEGDPTQAGIFLASTLIPVEDPASAFSEIKQSTCGLLGNWERGDWRVIGELYLFQNHLVDSQATHKSALQYGYLQGEYRLSGQFQLFGRTEHSSGENSRLTLQEFPEFARKRNMAGVRLELSRNQALKIEAGRLWRFDNAFNQVQFQWSAVFQ